MALTCFGGSDIKTVEPKFDMKAQWMFFIDAMFEQKMNKPKPIVCVGN